MLNYIIIISIFIDYIINFEKCRNLILKTNLGAGTDPRKGDRTSPRSRLRLKFLT